MNVIMSLLLVINDQLLENWHCDLRAFTLVLNSQGINIKVCISHFFIEGKYLARFTSTEDNFGLLPCAYKSFTAILLNKPDVKKTETALQPHWLLLRLIQFDRSEVYFLAWKTNGVLVALELKLRWPTEMMRRLCAHSTVDDVLHSS